MESTDLTDSTMKVFNVLKSIMWEKEFLEANQSFFVKNCDIFEDIEENKLEYTNIYNEYLMIIEEVLESRAKE